jgi:hypothetical protein
MNHVENRSVFTLTIEFPTDFNGEYMHEALSKATQIISEWTTRAIDTESSDPNPSDPDFGDHLSEEVKAALRVALTSLPTIFN